AVMINSNPETVSTDYDTSDVLFFEPLTLEDVLNVTETLNATGPASITEVCDAGETSLFPIRNDPKQECHKPTNFEHSVLHAASLHGITHLMQIDAVRYTSKKYDDGWHAQFVDRNKDFWLADFPLGKEPTLKSFDKDGDDWSELDEYFTESNANEIRRSVENNRSLAGVIVQYGGQTPLNLAHGLDMAGVPMLGTTLESIDRAEDRDRFDQMLTKLDLKRPASGIARSIDEAVDIAGGIGYPVLVRPSYVLGGRGMEICPDEKALRHYMLTAVDVSGLDDAPILIDQFLDNATELDIDVVADFDSGGMGFQPVSFVFLELHSIEKDGLEAHPTRKTHLTKKNPQMHRGFH
ncbi:MAG: hypothetical protein JKY96_02115, partial [Phycisphaerales bacterium]|nr:hypothetical protein [Phycisphaerales bacterium]